MNLKRELLNSENYGLTFLFHVSPDSCEDPAYYENFVKFSAMSDRVIGKTTTHVFIDKDTTKLAGFIALRASSLVSKSEDGNLVVHPSLEIAELAVGEEYERQGVGREMFAYTVSVAEQLRRETLAIKYIAVCAAERAVGFYQKLGFDFVGNLYEIPRDGWNNNCIPMYVTLPDL